MKITTLLFVLFVSTGLYSQEYNYYFGNLHAHSDYSDGNQEKLSCYDTPLESFEAAKESEHFDFLGISGHNHSRARGGVDDNITMSVERFHQGLNDASRATQEGSFVALYGLEWGLYATGHILVYGNDKLINWEEDNSEILIERNQHLKLFEAINNCNGCFAYLAHPKRDHFSDIFTMDYDTNTAKDFLTIADKAVIGMAMRNGPSHEPIYDYSAEVTSNYHRRFKDLLRSGYHVGVGIDHDNHYTNFGKSSKSRLVVLAENLSQGDILDAMSNRRFYASDDWNAEVKFEINYNTMGSIVKSDKVPKLFLDVTDEEWDKVVEIKVYSGISGSGKDPEVIKSYTDTDTFLFESEIEKNKEYYFYLEITQEKEKGDEEEDKIWTSPIWYTWE